MPSFSIKDGVLTAGSYVKARTSYTCKKGTTSTVTFEFPEGMTLNSKLGFNTKCGCCGEAVELPMGKHSINSAGELVSVYEPAP